MNIESKSYWEKYYSTHQNPSEPSPFCKFVMPFIQAGKSMIELGCGNGRDSVSFSKKDIHLTALDQCPTEIKYLSTTYVELSNLQFMACDMSEIDGIQNIDYIYSRFSLHSINNKQESKVINWAYKSLNPSGLFFIEARSINDDLYGQGEKIGKHEFITDHYRRFIDMNELISNCKSIGFIVLYAIESQGLARYHDEDPSVIRLILQK